MHFIDAAGRGRHCLRRRFARHALFQHLDQRTAPAGSRLGEIDVGVDAIQQALCAQLRQAAVEVLARFAKEFVRGVAEAEHREGGAIQLRRFFRHQEFMQRHRLFRRIAFTLRGGHHHQQLLLANLLELVIAGVNQLNVQLRRLQIVAQLLGDAARVAGLRSGNQRNRRDLRRRWRAGRDAAGRLIDHSPEVARDPRQLGGRKISRCRL